jgi:hypothetical protein
VTKKTDFITFDRQLLIWTIVDPLHRDVKNFPKLNSNNPEDDIEIQPQLEHCKSEHHYVWLGKTNMSDLGCTYVYSFVKLK